MEWILRNAKVYIGVLIWILLLPFGSTSYPSHYLHSHDSGESMDHSYYNYGFESRKTGQFKRQADYLQHLDVEIESTEEPQTQENTEEPANYDFEYKIHGGGNFLGHTESRRDIQTTGSYHVLMPDGRMQIVNYYADHTGYHPKITYELVNDIKRIERNSLYYNPNPRGQDYVPEKRNNLKKVGYSRFVRRTRVRSKPNS